MIRIVSFRKALLAGAAGAAAWEAALRLVALAGLPLVDLTRVMGTLLAPEGGAAVWWPLGFGLMLIVGVLWAVFYAYFFFSTFSWPAWVQGLLFAFAPAALAVGVVYPQLQLMHRAADVASMNAFELWREVGWREAAGLLLGNLIYGAVLGALYVRPVGYRSDRGPRHSPRPRRARGPRRRVPPPSVSDGRFIFATGVECSYPTIHGGRWRRDLMLATGHYRRWQDDLELTLDIGATHLRYGPPLHLMFLGPDRYDWSFTDEVLPAMRDLGLTPVIDLCHFGLPLWLENFQNPELAAALAAYAGAFAGRYPWIRFYTPVNEMYVCARLSALDGLWNEQRRDERSFVTAVRHLARANALMTQAILDRRSDAVFVNSESSEFFQPAVPDPEVVRIADFENQRRFLPLDLLYGHPPREDMRRYLMDNGMPAQEYEWFMRRQTPSRTIMGIDYYEWNEKLIDSDGAPRSLGELFGWYVIAKQYYDRYGRAMMHTETNRLDARAAPQWLWRQWHNVQLIRAAGVPVVGFTWYSLVDQVDWDIALTEPFGNVNPVGLFDLNRQPRPVAQAYQHLIRTFRDAPELHECPELKEILQ